MGTLREDNVRGAFVARPGGVPRRPLLIDDVQLDLAEIHRSVRDTWFGAQVVVEQEQTQA